MFRLIAVTTFAVSLALAQASVPKGATEVEPGVWKHTDTAGKTSLYRKTPFGVVKSDPSKDAPESKPGEASKQPAAPATTAATPSPFGSVKAAPDQSTKVVEKGDTLEFERPSPFGSYKWKAKKSELTAEEQEAWTKARGQQAAAKSTGPNE
jgi:hypothetical protein